MKDFLTSPNKIVAAIAVMIATIVLLMPTPDGLDPKLVKAGAVLFAAVAVYASHALPDHFTSLSFMLMAVILGVAPANVAFSGFMSSAVWMLFGGLFIGLAIQHTGLTDRIGRIGTRLGHLSYVKVLMMVTFSSLSLGFFMPASISRVIILVPIAFAIATALGFKEGRPGRMGIALAAGMGTFIPGSGILPANLPNVVMSGATETIYKLPFTYGEFLLWHFPVTGFLKAIILVLVLAWMYPDKREDTEHTPTDVEPGTTNQRLLTFILAATMCLWATDFIHRVAPGHISLFASLIIMLPLLKLVPDDALQKHINLTSFFYVAGILSVGAVVQHVGFGTTIANYLIEVTNPQPGQTFINFVTLSMLSMILCVFTTAPGAPVVLAPMAQELSQAVGMPLFTVVNIMTHGFATILFPYIGPPFVIAIALTKMPVGQGLKLCFVMAAISILLLMPLTYLWWQWLGFFK